MLDPTSSNSPHPLALSSIHHLTSLLRQRTHHSIRESYAQKKVQGTILPTLMSMEQRTQISNLLLRSLMLAIGEARNFEVALHMVLQQMCELTGWNFAETWLPNTQETMLTYSSIWYGNSDVGESFYQESCQLTFASGVGLPGRVWETGEPEWHSNVSSLPNDVFSRTTLVEQAGFKAVVGIPILDRDQVLAVLVFFIDRFCETDLALVSLIAAIAAHLGTVMHLKRTETNLYSRKTRLTRLLNSLPGIVFISNNDPAWSMAYFSNGCQSLLGYAPNELIGEAALKSYSDITHPEDMPHILQVIDNAIAQKQPYVVEYRVYTKTGEEKWVWEKGYGIYGADDKVLGLEGFITDITERKQSERTLQEQEQFLRLVLETIPQHIFWKDKNLIYQGGNTIWARSLGYDSPQALVGKTDAELWDAETARQYQERDRQVLDKQEPCLNVIRPRQKQDGKFIWQDLSKVPIHNAQGDVVGVLGTFTDITQRKQAEDALSESEQRYRFLANHATDLISRHQLDGAYLYASPACRTLLGYEPEELLGRLAYHLFHPDDLAQVKQAHQMALANPDSDITPFCYRVRRKDGQYIWFETTGKAVTDPRTGEVQELVAVSRDISDRQRTANSLLIQKRVLEMIATDCPLLETLNVLTQLLNDQIEGAKVSILLLDDEGQRLHCAASANLPLEYVNAIDGVAIAPDRGSCGSAICQQRLIISKDIVKDIRWKYDCQVALQHGLRACWSQPIVSSQGQVFGTFATYYDQPKEPSSAELQALEIATHLAGIAIERKQVDKALRQAENKYRSIVENAVEGIFQTTLDGHYLTANSMLAKIYGYESPEDLVRSLTNVTEQLYVDAARRRDFVKYIEQEGAVFGFESQVRRKNGEIIWISECARTIRNAVGEPIGYEGTIEDITQRKVVEAELHYREQLLQGVAEATNCLLTNPDIQTAIPDALAILGQASGADRVYIYENHPHPSTGELSMSMRYEWVGLHIPSSITQPHWQNQPYSTFGMERWYRAFLAGQPVSGQASDFPLAEQELLQRDRILSILMVPVFIDDQLWGYIGFDDCSQERTWLISDESILVAIAASIGGAIKRQHTEHQMRYQAFHDALTGLPNRSLFDHRLPLAIAQAHRHKELLAVAFLDLDRFKTINDTLGHAIGDQLLKKVTQRLQDCLGEENTLARWGGDEFTLILPNLHSPKDAALIAQQVIHCLRPEFQVVGHDLHITGSLGIALYPQDGNDPKTLVQNADAALYRVKEQGRDHYAFYTSTINSQASELLVLDNNLRHALKREEFVIHYQPQVDLQTGKMVQVEALMRWRHPQKGLVSPGTFIPLAEENGMIIPMGEWILEAVCHQIQAWQRLGLQPIPVSVNLSARQFQQPNLAQTIATILTDTHTPPHLLDLEITETAAMQDVEFTCAILEELRSMGVQISIDDFGTGYSSLNYLKRFPLNALKIDRTFVDDLTRDASDAAIVAAVITLGHGLNLRIVAEGVETQAQADLLRSLQCDVIQGYWFSPPLTAEDMSNFLNQQLV